MTTELTFPGYVPGNNGNKGLLRMSHFKKSALRDAYVYHIRSLTRNRHPGPVTLELTRYGVGVEPDYDNLVSTGKLLLDAFKLAGVIVDDKPSILLEPNYRFERVNKAQLQKTIVRFTDFPSTQALP